jgi:acyl-CoA thioesterase I
MVWQTMWQTTMLNFSLSRLKAFAMSVFVAGTAISLVLLSSPVNAQVSKKSVPHILVVGDSLSAEYGLVRGKGWVALLSARLTERGVTHQMVNASISGETTSGGRTRFSELLQKHTPTHVILQLGANDALRGLALTQTQANLKSMVVDAKKYGATVVIVGIQIPPNYGKSYTEAFKAVFPTIANEQKTQLVPFMLEGFADKPEFFQKDRIHPNESAHPIILNSIWPAIAPALKLKP